MDARRPICGGIPPNYPWHGSCYAEGVGASTPHPLQPRAGIHYSLFAAVALAASACGGGRELPDFAGDYDDPVTPLGRMDGSTFVEIGEVLVASDEVAFFCSGVRGLNMVDISDPARPVLVRQMVSVLGDRRFPRCQHVATDGDRVWYSNRGDELQPTPFIAGFDLGANLGFEVDNHAIAGVIFEGITASGGYLYAAAHSDGLIVFDATGDELVEVGRATDLGNAWGVAVDGDIAVVADGAFGVATIDVSDPSNPIVLAKLATGGAAQSVTIDGERAIAAIAASQAGVVLVDIADPRAPQLLSTVETPGTALQVALSGDRAFVADWNDLRVLDVSDPRAPRTLATERPDTPDDFPRVFGVGAVGDDIFAGEWTGFFSFRYHPDRSAPDLYLGQRRIDFGPVAAGELAAQIAVVENHGTEPLIIWDVESGDDFAAPADVVTIEPAGAFAVEIRFSPGDVDAARTDLTLWSDDPDRRASRLELRGNQPVLGVGDPAPAVDASLLDGGEWHLADQRGSVVVLAYFATF